MRDFSSIPPRRAEPYPFSEDQLAWLKELETTQRKKGRGYLEYKDSFCCLGIACVQFGALKTLSPYNHGMLFRMTEQGAEELSYLPAPLAYRLRTRGKAGEFESAIRVNGRSYGSLVSMNDDTESTIDGGIIDTFTFPDIAAYIRHDPWNVFVSEEEARTRYEGLPIS